MLSASRLDENTQESITQHQKYGHTGLHVRLELCMKLSVKNKAQEVVNIVLDLHLLYCTYYVPLYYTALFYTIINDIIRHYTILYYTIAILTIISHHIILYELYLFATFILYHIINLRPHSRAARHEENMR